MFKKRAQDNSAGGQVKAAAGCDGAPLSIHRWQLALAICGAMLIGVVGSRIGGGRLRAAAAPTSPRWAHRETRDVHFPSSSVVAHTFKTTYDMRYGGHDWWDEVDSYTSHATGKRWEPATFTAIRQALTKRRGVHVDSGAWIGPTALWASAFASRVLAVEPDPVAYDELVANFALNPHLRARTDTWKGCISTRVETLKFEGVGVSVSSAVKADAKPDASHWDAHCDTLESVLSQHGVMPGELAMLKLDVEGAELHLFPALIPTLEQHAWPFVHLSTHPAFWQNVRPDGEETTALAKAMLQYHFIYHIEGDTAVRVHHVDPAQIVGDYVLGNQPLDF